MLHVPKSLAGVQVAGVETMPGSGSFLRGIGSLILRGRWAPPKISVPDPETVTYSENVAQQRRGITVHGGHGHESHYQRERAKELSEQVANPPRSFDKRQKLLDDIAGPQRYVSIATSFGVLYEYRQRSAGIYRRTLLGVMVPITSGVLEEGFFITRTADESAMLYVTNAATFGPLGEETISYSGYMSIDIPRRRILVREACGYKGKQSPEVDLIVGTFMDKWFRGSVDVFLGDDPAFFA